MSDLIAVKQAPELRLWTPQGVVDPTTSRAKRVVEQYDERLMLARHEGTGDWCVWLKKGPFGGEPFPVVGLGKELPDPETLERRLMQADTARHRDKILRDMNANNERIRAAEREAADQASGIAAEALEWGFRKEGAHPSPRIFVPRNA
jgi:hypothetical protein